MSVADVTAVVLRSYPDVEDAAGGELVASLGALLHGSAAAEFAAARQALLAQSGDARRRRREELGAPQAAAALFAMRARRTRVRLRPLPGTPFAGKRLDASWVQLQLTGPSLAWFAADQATQAALEKHVLRVFGGDTLDAALRLLQADQEGDAQQPAADADSLTDAQRRTLAKTLAPDARASALAAADAVQGKGGSLAELETALQTLGAEAGVRLRKLEKKAERAAAAAQVQQHMTARLRAAETPADVLLWAVPLLCTRVRAWRRPVTANPCTHVRAMARARPAGERALHQPTWEAAGRGDRAAGGGGRAAACRRRVRAGVPGRCCEPVAEQGRGRGAARLAGGQCAAARGARCAFC